MHDGGVGVNSRLSVCMRALSAGVMYKCNAAGSQQQRRVLPQHNGGDLKTDFPLSLRFGMEAGNVLPCKKKSILQPVSEP